MTEPIPSTSEGQSELVGKFQEISDKFSGLEENTNKQLANLVELVNSLESKKILDQANEIVVRQKILQKSQEKVNKAVEEIIDFAHLEINSPAGIIPDKAKIVKRKKVEENRLTKSFHKILIWLLKFIASVLWAVFGFYLWLGLLIRTVLSYSAQISASVFSNRSTAKAQQRLYWVAGYYLRGFLNAFPTSTEPTIPEPGEDEEELWHSLQALFVEFVKSTATYFFIFVAPSLVKNYFSTN